MLPRLWMLALAVLACLALAACGSGGDSEPTATVVAQPTVTPTPPLVEVGEVVWTSAVDPATGSPVDRLTALPNTAPRVIATVNVASLPAGTSLQARWTIDGDPLPALEPAPVTVEAARANAWIAWTLTWDSDQPWPVGRLGIAIEVNGETQRTGEIPIVRDGG
jgi:hypothetical protein